MGARGRSWLIVGGLVLFACNTDAPLEHEDPPIATRSSALVGYDCGERSDTGYSNGNAFSITVVTVDGNPVERDTANALLTLMQAAEGAGVYLGVNSGFRTWGEQSHLYYDCYKGCQCNSCNLAAPPGYSNHQSGHAVDLSASDGYGWLFAHGGEFGWANTVPSEKWHWEWWGGGPTKSFCPACSNQCDGNVLRRADCSATNCGDMDATCKNDGGGLRCEPNCHNRCVGNVLERDDCSKTSCGGDAVCREGGGLRCDARPRGTVDTVDSLALRGWAYDPSVPQATIGVRVSFDATSDANGGTLRTYQADRSRADLCQALGSCAHAFERRTPRSLLDNAAHVIRFVAPDVSGGEDAELAGSPRTLRAPPPAIQPGTVLRRVPSAQAFAVWAFSAFEDVAPLPDDKVGGGLLELPWGPELPNAPDVVTPDDGTGTIWVLDQGVRRFVADAAAWRLPAPKTELAVLLYQLPKGPDFPKAPELVSAVGPTYYVIDVPIEGGSPSPGSPAGSAGQAAGVGGRNAAPPGAAGTAGAADFGEVAGAAGANAMTLSPASTESAESAASCASAPRGGEPASPTPPALALALAVLGLRARSSRRVSGSVKPVAARPERTARGSRGSRESRG